MYLILRVSRVHYNMASDDLNAAHALDHSGLFVAVCPLK